MHLMEDLLFLVLPLPAIREQLVFSMWENTFVASASVSLRKVLPYSLCKSTTWTLLLLLKRIEIWNMVPSPYLWEKIIIWFIFIYPSRTSYMNVHVFVCICICVCAHLLAYYMIIIDLYRGHSAAINRCQPQRGEYKMQMQNDEYFI